MGGRWGMHAEGLESGRLACRLQWMLCHGIPALIPQHPARTCLQAGVLPLQGCHAGLRLLQLCLQPTQPGQPLVALTASMCASK